MRLHRKTQKTSGSLPWCAFKQTIKVPTKKQISLADILRSLPNFQLIYRFSGDVLLKNKRLK